MRIAYVALYLDRHIILGGVGEKIGMQLKCWRSLGHETSLFYLAPDDARFEGGQAFRYRPLLPMPVIKSFTRFLSRSAAMVRLIARLQEYQPALIYLRQGLYVFPIGVLYGLAPVVVEFNTNDVAEARLQGCLVYWFNRFTRGLLLRKASGFIFPSHELAETQFNAVYQKPARVISNGIDLMKNPPLPPAANSHPVITLVGSPGMKWHGVDKIVKLAERFPDLNFNIVGYQISDFGSSIPPNIRVLGFLSREEVRQVLRETDVACGTLALHRKGMNEASPLKVREAVSCGLPVILGYYDTDLSDLAGEYILHLPNTEDNVESCAEQIHSFAYRMMGKRMDQQSVRERIDQQRKELARVDFLIEIFRQFRARNNG